VTLPLSYSRLNQAAQEVPRLRSGFRRRAQTPANRLNLEGCDSTTELLPPNKQIPSFHSGFRLWAPATLTPAKRLKLLPPFKPKRRFVPPLRGSNFSIAHPQRFRGGLNSVSPLWGFQLATQRLIARGFIHRGARAPASCSTTRCEPRTLPGSPGSQT